MRRIGSCGRVMVAAFCVATSLGACDPGTTPPRPRLPFMASMTAAPSGTATPSASGAATPAPSGTPAPASSSAAAAAEWKTFTTADEQLMFDYPPDWTIKDRAVEAAPGGVFVDVLNGAGTSMASLRTNLAIGAECTEKYPYFLMDSEELPALAQGGAAPRFVYEGRAYAGTDLAGSSSVAYGITSAATPSGPTACPIFHYFPWPPGVAMFGGTYNPIASTPGDPSPGDTPAAYTGTAEYDDIRQMITSLRPVGK